MTKVRNAAFVLLFVVAVALGTEQASAQTDWCVGGWSSQGFFLWDIYCDSIWWDGYWPDHSCAEFEEYLPDICPEGLQYYFCEDGLPGPPPELPTADYTFRCAGLPDPQD